MLIRTHVGVSLDGFVATPDGLPVWDAMPTFGPGSHGAAEFIEQCDAPQRRLGRIAGLAVGGWPTTASPARASPRVPRRRD